MDKNIYNYINTMDEKWIFLLIINIDISEKLYRHLVEMEKLSPPLGLHHFNPPYQWKYWEENQWLLKGQRDADSSM